MTLCGRYLIFVDHVALSIYTVDLKAINREGSYLLDFC
jgi:hypothetical protein